VVNQYYNSIVIVGNSTQGLGTIRSAVNLNLPVFVLHDLHFCSSRFSRYTDNYRKLPKGTIKSLADSPDSKVLTENLLKLPVKFPSPLFGINEDIINYFAFNKEILKEKYFIADNKYHLIFDKYEFNKQSPPENQIPTFLLRDINLDEYVGKDYILKSRRGNKLRNFTDEKAVLLRNYNGRYKEILKNNFSGDELIIQRIIKSSKPVTSVCSFSVEGKIFGLFQYEKLRQHPNQFGTGTYLKSIFDDELKNLAEIILEKLQYTGISEIEFIYDNEDQKYKAIEINPRTWKSIGFSTMCRQNLVEKYCKYALSKEIDNNLTYKTNEYWVDIFTDFTQMLREKRIFSYSIKNLHECMWDNKDPLPFISSVLFAPFILMRI
jgi:predicted ATP-grasp superfamily ATP-dependent carboligase